MQCDTSNHSVDSSELLMNVRVFGHYYCFLIDDDLFITILNLTARMFLSYSYFCQIEFDLVSYDDKTFSTRTRSGYLFPSLQKYPNNRTIAYSCFRPCRICIYAAQNANLCTHAVFRDGQQPSVIHWMHVSSLLLNIGLTETKFFKKIYTYEKFCLYYRNEPLFWWLRHTEISFIFVDMFVREICT